MDAQADTFRAFHARRERARLEERENLRLDILDRAKAAILRQAPAFPAIRAAYLFGSILQPGQFHEGSDVDIAIDCDDIGVETPFWRALEDELQRNVDVRPREGAVARAVEAYGEKVYGR
ncbi:MAG: nucleotidyltransferase domain-containing protein [Acidobacteriota bacterium]